MEQIRQRWLPLLLVGPLSRCAAGQDGASRTGLRTSLWISHLVSPHLRLRRETNEQNRISHINILVQTFLVEN